MSLYSDTCHTSFSTCVTITTDKHLILRVIFTFFCPNLCMSALERLYNKMVPLSALLGSSILLYLLLGFIQCFICPTSNCPVCFNSNIAFRIPVCKHLNQRSSFSYAHNCFNQNFKATACLTLQNMQIISTCNQHISDILRF